MPADVFASPEYVIYARTSTRRRWRQRLRRQVSRLEAFVSDNRGHVIGSFRDIGQAEDETLSGRMTAIEQAYQENATLLVTSIDRFSRDPQFVEDWLRVIRLQTVSHPQASNSDLVRLARQELFRQVDWEEEQEQRRILDGRPPSNSPNDDGLMRRRIRARTRARKVSIVIKHLRRNGVSTLQVIADELNRIGVKTPTGRGEWKPNTVSREERTNRLHPTTTRFPKEIWNWFLPEIFETEEHAAVWLDSVLSRDDQ
ncbi:MAG: recombinase family protein [Rhodospirillales bacterium]